METGEHVRKSMLDFDDGDVESSMMHACAAIDGTAKKRYPSKRVGDRFTQLIRDHYDIFGPMALPAVDLHAQRWPIEVKNPTAPGGGVDTADLIYGIHRCTHGHGDVLPQGFELLPNAMGEQGVTHTIVSARRLPADGRVQLSDRVVWGLLGVAVLAPENKLQRIPEGFGFVYGRKQVRLDVNEWWGRAADFPAVVATDPPVGFFVEELPTSRGGDGETLVP